jgi:antitoxin component HigA of HigAB toxin-antitoxin module
MIYFKDTALPPSQLDPTQLAKVFEFKKRIESEGGLHWTFSDQFEDIAELHLLRHLQEFQKVSQDSLQRLSAADTARRQSSVDEDEVGILDYMEAYHEHFARLIEVQKNITDAIEDLGDRMTERAEELNRAKQEGRKGDLPYLRRMASKAAEDMAQFVARMDVDIPIFASEFEAGFRAFMNGVATSRDFEDPNDAKDLREMLDTLATIKTNLDAARLSVVGLRNSAANLPRIATVLNRAKRATVAVLDRLIREFDAADTLLREVKQVLESRLRDIEAAG